jgi:steroid delta-isomerase
MSTAPDRTQANTETVNRYLAAVAAGSVDDIVEQYADDATVEDPVGSGVHIGRQAIRGFYSKVINGPSETAIVTLRALSNEVAFLWNLTVSLDDAGKTRIEIISVMMFGEDSKITSMKAYWGPENIKPV